MSAPLWSAGFRIFFWLGALNAAASLATWMAFLSGLGIGTQGWPAQSLHAHEMLHGTVVPVIAGFLLTAVPNWSGTATLRGTLIGDLQRYDGCLVDPVEPRAGFFRLVGIRESED